MGKYVSILIIALFFFSCDSNVIFNSTTSLDGIWNKNDTVFVELPKLDSLKTYNLNITLRNSNEYKYNNLFLIVSMEFPKGKTIVDTLEYRMAEPDGTWLGTGLGSIKENVLKYKMNASFNETGNYRVKILHAMRNNGTVEGVSNLEGILDIGLSIENTVSN